jgi:hypothetical protein
MSARVGLTFALALGLLAPSSGAWSDTPRVTKRWVRAVLSPDQSLPDVIAPTRGVYITPPGSPTGRNVCGAAQGMTLPVLLAAVAARLRDAEHAAGTFHCENRPQPRCQITSADEPVIELCCRVY